MLAVRRVVGECARRVSVARSLSGRAWGVRAHIQRTLTAAGRPRLASSLRSPSQMFPFYYTYSPVSSILSSRGYADLPRHKVVKLPALSPTMDTGMIVSWEKEVGDELSEGDVLAQVETDKATMDMETPSEGFLAKILVEPGIKDLPLGKPLCVIVDDEGDVAAFSDYQPEEASPASAAADPPPEPTAPPPHSPSPAPPPPQAPSIPSQPTATLSSAGAGGRIFASPFAKNIANERGVDLQGIQGTGMGGRIVSRDVLQTTPTATPTAAEFTDLDLTSMRKTIAKRLVEAKQSIPHYYLTIDIIMDRLLDVRSSLNQSAGGHYKLSVNDFIVKAAALTMYDVPEVNSSWMDTFIRQYHNVDVSVAVATPNGLITPIVKNADGKGLRAINADIAQLAEKAREGRLQPHEFQGGTFTISNLGMYGVKQFSAVINPPQSCILAVGATEKRIVVDDSSAQGHCTANVMTVTLSCDHRVVDGAVGAEWLSTFRTRLQDPNTMLL